MASVVNSKSKRYLFKSDSNEEHQLFLQSDADLFIKKLSEKQLDTNCTLERCLKIEKQFNSSHTYFSFMEPTITPYDPIPNNIEQVANFDTDRKYSQSETISRHTKELALTVKPNSVETKLFRFAIDCKALKNASYGNLPADHPFNNLNRIEKELFDHSKHSDDLEKTVKMILRKRKQLLNAITEPIGPENNINVPQNTSFWDVTETKKRKTQANLKIYSCKPKQSIEKLFTIQKNKIIEVKTKTKSEKRVVKWSNSTFVCLDDNSTDSKNFKKLNEQDIQKLSSFQNYSKGNPSKVLYLKNLASCVKEEDLIWIFSKYQKLNEHQIIYKLMQKGKMRGQAFIEFSCLETAIQALEEVNGTILYNKPIIIQFSKAAKN